MTGPFKGAESIAGAKPDWAALLADRILRTHERRRTHESDAVVIASGLSPSGPIHLGNLRELMLPHYVAEEIRARGVPCDHIVSWDDYDRLRRVPAGVPESFAEHIGRPLTAVPDPGGTYESWAERFKAPFRQALDELGVPVREISQTEMYTGGSYLDPILVAIDARLTIDEVLDKFRTIEAAAAESADDAQDADASALETTAEDGDDEDARTAGAEYWPYKVYCQTCGRDFTHIESIDRGEGRCIISYRCTACEHRGAFDLYEENHGKLVWKVDWPMRWAYERVTFEAAGADHSSPGSSFSVGSELVGRIFDGEPPEYEAYSFVGIRGMSKLSSSAGAVPTPADALSVLEPPILRWMYVRKTPRQSITVDLGSGIGALYDEWDSLGRKVAAGDATPNQVLTYERARRSSMVEAFPSPAKPVPFRTLASASSVGAGDDAQIARIVSELTDVDPANIADTEPRLTLAGRWVDELAPESERVVVRAEPDLDRLAALSDTEATWLRLMLEHLEDDWSLEGARALVYGVPKLAAGLAVDAPPTDELKVEQRTFFKLLYELLISADTGPRMPTLLMALGPDRVRTLLGPLAA